MKLRNTTEWNTKDLRKLVLENLKRAGVDPRWYKFKIKNHAGIGYEQSIFGCAYVYQQDIDMMIQTKRVNKETMLPEACEFDAVYFSQVLQHEIDHTRGIHDHDDMMNHWEINCDWAKGFSVRNGGGAQ